MSNQTPGRVQPGIPEGGQFATGARSEAQVSLNTELGELDEAKLARVKDSTDAVAAQLGIGETCDDGAGPYIGFDCRHAGAGDRDMAFFLEADEAVRPEQADKWIFQRGDSGEVLSNGFYTDGATSEFTLESDPAEVAAWIKTQMQHFGTPGAPA